MFKLCADFFLKQFLLVLSENSNFWFILKKYWVCLVAWYAVIGLAAILNIYHEIYASLVECRYISIITLGGITPQKWVDCYKVAEFILFSLIK